MLNHNLETWKQATRIHEVSNYGRIRNLHTGHVLGQWIHTAGYLMITIRNHEGASRKHLRVHRMVAEAFIPNPKNLSEVNHLDGNKQNNHVANLEWTTHADNMSHAGNTELISRKPRTLGKKLGKTSKYRNVGWDSNREKWIAGVTHKTKRLGSKRFTSEEDAALHVNYLIDVHKLSIPKNIIV